MDIRLPTTISRYVVKKEKVQETSQEGHKRSTENEEILKMEGVSKRLEKLIESTTTGVSRFVP